MIEFLIPDMFTDSLAKLPNDSQRSVKATVFDLHMNPASPGMSFHKLDGVKDPNFWSVRVSRDVRRIVHKTSASLLLCYVDHYDRVYKRTGRQLDQERTMQHQQRISG